MMFNRARNIRKQAYDLRMTNICHAYDKSYGRSALSFVKRSALLTVTLLFAFFTSFAAPAMADKLSIGDVFLCESENDFPDVEIWIGKIDRLNLTSIAGDSSVLVVHLSIKGDGEEFPTLNHAPFKFESLGNCLAKKTGNRSDIPQAFSQSYAKWKSGLNANPSPYSTKTPVEVYWTALGKMKN